MRLIASLLAFLALLVFAHAGTTHTCPSWTGNCYSYAGVIFDQDGTFDQFSPLTVGNYPGVTPSYNPVQVTRQGTLGDTLFTRFPDNPNPEFDGLLSIGSLAKNGEVAGGSLPPPGDTDKADTRAYALGDGLFPVEGASSDRAGIELSYSSRSLANFPGADLMVVTASPPGQPSVVIMQVLISGKIWSDWVYVPPTVAGSLSGTVDGFVLLVDLSSFDVEQDVGFITGMRIVNMAITDRVVNASGLGVVLPEDDGQTKPSYWPEAPSIADYGTLGSTTYSPSVLWVAPVHQTVSTAPRKCNRDDEDCDDDMDDLGTKVHIDGSRRRKGHKKGKKLTEQTTLVRDPTKGPIAAFTSKAEAQQLEKFLTTNKKQAQ